MLCQAIFSSFNSSSEKNNNIAEKTLNRFFVCVFHPFLLSFYFSTSFFSCWCFSCRVCPQRQYICKRLVRSHCRTVSQLQMHQCEFNMCVARVSRTTDTSATRLCRCAKTRHMLPVPHVLQISCRLHDRLQKSKSRHIRSQMVWTKYKKSNILTKYAAATYRRCHTNRWRRNAARTQQ